MILISCDKCGVVFDGTKLNFPNEDLIYKDDSCEADETISAWDGEEYRPKVACPVCKGDILK